MQPRKLDLLIATYPYGGNGGVSSEHPDVRNWLLGLMPILNQDERIGRVSVLDTADTPITMTRNRSVLQARKGGYDLLLMVDSDMRPDCLAGTPGAVPFWDAAFEFIYSRYERGPNMVAAPYTGPPPNSCVYVFKWGNKEDGDNAVDEMDIQLEQYTREESVNLAGIQEAAALPTGLCLWDMRLFDITEPSKLTHAEVLNKYKNGELSEREALRCLQQGWFYYEWTDGYAQQKGSTEDVTATRDASLLGIAALGYNPIHCAWSSWAGHWKPKCCSKPVLLTADCVSKRFVTASDRLASHQKFIDQRSPIALEIDWAQATRPHPNGDHKEQEHAAASTDDTP